MAITNRDIQDFAARIAAAFNPEKIILFGSRAYGTAREDSDVDLLVILPFTETPFRKTVDILNKTLPRFAVDLLARTPEDTAMRYTHGDPLIREAIDRGQVLYEKAA